jgi:hypothetical protein
MRIRTSLLAVVALAVALSGCTRYYFASGEASCLEVIRQDDFRVPKVDLNFLRWWQSTEYCRGVRERFERSFQASLPNFGVLRPQQSLVVGNTVTFEVGVRNEGVAASPDFNVRIEAWAGVAPPAPPSFSVMLRFTGLAPGADSRQNVNVSVPSQRPVDVLVRVTADPPTATSPGGDVWESDENNNVRERTFTIY